MNNIVTVVHCSKYEHTKNCYVLLESILGSQYLHINVFRPGRCFVQIWLASPWMLWARTQSVRKVTPEKIKLLHLPGVGHSGERVVSQQYMLLYLQLQASQ